MFSGGEKSWEERENGVEVKKRKEIELVRLKFGVLYAYMHLVNSMEKDDNYSVTILFSFYMTMISMYSLFNSSILFNGFRIVFA